MRLFRFKGFRRVGAGCTCIGFSVLGFSNSVRVLRVWGSVCLGVWGLACVLLVCGVECVGFRVQGFKRTGARRMC